MIGPLPLLGAALVAASLAMAALWLVQRRHGDAGIVDVAWSAGIGACALAFAVLADGWVPRRALVGALGAAWSLRLAIYIWRRVRGGPEDGRYQELRRQYGPRVQTFFFWFYQFQGVAVVLFALPLLLAMRAPSAAFTAWDAAGAAIWLIAVAGEATADAQLARFRRNPANRGRTCRDGLWRYSRHPNYFFEFVHWFAYVAIGIGAPWGALTLLGPALMLFFLLKVTGIPVTEQRALATRGDDYRRYVETTSAFVPWFPRRSPVQGVSR